MKKYYLIITLLGWQTVKAQEKPPAVSMAEVSRYIGRTVKVNGGCYKSANNGRLLTVYLNGDSSLKLVLTGDSRRKIINEMRGRRELNRQIKSPLDTSITAIGKISSKKGQWVMQVNQAYLGVDLKIIKE